MTVSIGDLRSLVNTTTGDDGVLERCLALGTALVDDYTSRVASGRIPEVILDEAVLTAASDQFHRRKAPNGILNQAYDTADGTGITAVHVSRDPYASIKPLLKRWVNSGGLKSVALSTGPDC